MTAAHVFVVRGSLTNLRCDAWMLPTDRALNIRHHWRIDGVMDAVEPLRRSSDFAHGKVLAAPLGEWPDGSPLPVLTSVPMTGVRTPADIEPALIEFISVAAGSARRRKPPSKPRRRPLLGMPLFSTEGGGGDRIRGALLSTILRVGAQAAESEGVDLALVLRDPKAFALAQVIRKRSSEQHWANLSPELMKKAEQLGERAKAHRLVPFMGAGVSVSAGAPDWRELLEVLANKVGIGKAEQDALFSSARDVLDQAAYLRAAFIENPVETEADDGGFALTIAMAVNVRKYGMAPALLANLNSEQAITLNYDELFEIASEDAGSPRAVIPSANSVASEKWLLKLHGTVAQPETIVLTRDDYLGFNASRAALSAIVKATLITHHLLFVGFGLADDHFHQIIHDVRRALPAERSNEEPLATALTLRFDPLDAKLWKGQLELIHMGGIDTSIAEAARTLEIFLDALLAFATDSHSYLLANGYDNELAPGERHLREALLDFAAGLTDEQRSGDSWPVLRKAMEDLGLDPD